MAWKSPYRGQEDLPFGLSPRVKEIISRGALVVLAAVLLYFGLRGLHGMFYYDSLATSQPVSPNGRRLGVPIYSYLSALALTFFGLLTLAAALVPVATMQRVFERFNQPPVTGERDSGSRYGTWWDWWP